MASVVEQAIAAAKAASEATAAQAATQAATPGTAVAQANASSVSTAVLPGKKMTMDDVAGGGMSVDAWFKCEKDGLRIGDNPIKFQDMPVILTMTDGMGFIIKKGIKGGNPAQYAYTQDGVTCVTGGSWEAAQARIRAVQANAAEYRCVDLPFTVQDDFEVTHLPTGKTEVVKEIIATKGQIIGYTTSTTNWAAWAKFYSQVNEAGLMGKRVLLLVGTELRKNKNLNEWGTMTFKLVGDADELMAEAE